MPLDSGAVTEVGAAVFANEPHARVRRPTVILNPSGNVGAALRMARESLGLSLQDIAMATCVRPPYLAAIEAFDLQLLPSRPFAVGYVRAYAIALGLDAATVVARFRAEAPAPDTALRPPMGIVRSTPARFGRIAFAAGLLVTAVVSWNLARHAVAAPSRRVVADITSPTQRAAMLVAGPAHLGGPLPAPPEATTPAPYETPGLAAASAAGGSADAADVAAHDARLAAAGIAAPVSAGAPFVAAGTVYGAPSPGSGVILQAVKPTSLVIHGQDGAVYFARQLAAGEAWRAPALAGLVVDVGNPGSIEVFVGGLSRGPLSAAKTPLAHLGGQG